VLSGSDLALEAILEEFLTRRENDQDPDPQEYVERHSEYAAQLRRFFDDLEYVEARLGVKESPFPADVFLDSRADDRREGFKSTEQGAEGGLPSIGRFKILEELGSGSQGVVYKAEQLGTKRTVALKVIREGAFASRAERRRFENEVQLASQLKHPNIVSVFECGRDRGREYFAMEYAEGLPLDTYLSNQTLTVEQTVRLLLQVCDGVKYAHQRGVIHRDLKPGNVVVDAQGQIHVLDFGLAKRVADESDIPTGGVTQPGAFAGTWYYASPEQVQGDSAVVDVRSDVYTLGVILYEALTDTYPYPVDGESREKIRQHILNTTPMRPSTIRGDIGDDLDTILLRALQKDPERRYQSTAAFGEDLRRFLAGEAIEAKRDSRWYVLRMTLRQHRRMAAAVVVGVATLLTFAVTVTILYAEATAARATTELRAKMVRDGQRFVVERLDELHLASNVLNDVRRTHADHPALSRLRKSLKPYSTQSMAEVVQDAPTRLDRSLRRPGTAEFGAGMQWLVSRSGQLDEVEAASREQRFGFGLDINRASDPDWIIAGMPTGVNDAAAVCEALAARAAARFHESRDADAISSLTAARSIALDLGDGRSLMHSEAGILARLRTYETILWILQAIGTDPTRAEPYVAWVQTDPPLPSLKETAILERMKLSQLFEAGLKADREGSAAFFDIDALNQRFPGLGKIVRSALESPNGDRQAVSITDAVETFDAFSRELEIWESLTPREIRERDVAFSRNLEGGSTSRLLSALLPNVRPIYLTRARTASTQSASRLASHLCRYRARFGQWPGRMTDAAALGMDSIPKDPMTGLEFGYRAENGACTLYSFNDDGIDNHGLAGDWGQPNTDVILFAPANPQ